MPHEISTSAAVRLPEEEILSHSVGGKLSQDGAKSQNETLAAAARALVRVHDLQVVLVVLEDAGVRPLAFKGPVLDAELRGDPFVRDSEDLDLLVPRDELDRALAALDAAGWTAALEIHPRTRAALLRYGCEIPLLRPGRTLLDLHWDLAPAYFAWRPDLDALRARARVVEVAGRPVPTLSRADAFLHLCAHGCLSDWSRGIWVEDVALAMERLGARDAALVLREARRTGGVRMVAVAVALAEARHGAAGPGEFRAAALADPVARSLAAFYGEILDGTARLPRSAAERTALHLRARERLRDRAHHVLGLLQTPALAAGREPPVPAPVRWTRRLARGVPSLAAWGRR